MSELFIADVKNTIDFHKDDRGRVAVYGKFLFDILSQQGVEGTQSARNVLNSIGPTNPSYFRSSVEGPAEDIASLKNDLAESELEINFLKELLASYRRTNSLLMNFMLSDEE